MSLSIAASLGSLPQLSPTSRPKHQTDELSSKKNIEDEFLEIARKSPVERMREKILEDMKISEESLAAMDSESRQAVEDEIKRRMMEALEASTETGQLVDKSA